MSLRWSEWKIRGSLSLDDERKSRLSAAVLKSVAYDQWNQCLAYRVKNMPGCMQDIAQELSRSVGAVVSGPSLLGEQHSKVVDLSKKSMNDAVTQCGVTPDEADRVIAPKA